MGAAVTTSRRPEGPWPSTGLGDEGGFAPNLESNRAALTSSSRPQEAGFGPVPTSLALDGRLRVLRGRLYLFEGEKKTAAQMVDYYAELADAYPMVPSRIC